jgi:predicted SprT family Zn-dependent metalloprotease
MTTQIQLQNLTDKLWLEYCETFPKMIRFNAPIVTINNRLSKTAGRNFMEENKIEMSGKFLAQFQSNMLRVILPHEIAHQIDWNLNGWYERKPHHGKDWITVMCKLNQAPNPYHNMILAK